VIATLSRRELRNLFFGKNIVLAEGNYALLDYHWLQDFLSTWRREVPQWREKFDCDDIAFMLKARMQLLHSESSEAIDGIACAVIFYTTDSGSGHAINFMITKVDGEQKIFYVEPQTGEIVWPSGLELESVSFIYV
jgi:hypothetical protein